jgi:hypothetical protein
MFKFLIKLLKDEKGLIEGIAGLGAGGTSMTAGLGSGGAAAAAAGGPPGWLIGGAAMLGSTLLGGLFGKKKEKTYDPYAALREQYKTYLGNKLGKTTPYSYNDAFTLDQPAIEKQTEGVISQGLGNLPKKRTDIFDINQKYGTARKAQMGLQQEEVSSTPGIQAETDLRYKQGLDKNVIDAEVAQQGIGQEMDAERLYQDVANQYMTQGQTLGQLQREYQKYGINMSEADIQRMIEEELAYSQQANSLLGGNPPQVSYQPNFWSQLGQTGQDVGSTMMLANILGKK